MDARPAKATERLRSPTRDVWVNGRTQDNSTLGVPEGDDGKLYYFAPIFTSGVLRQATAAGFWLAEGTAKEFSMGFRRRTRRRAPVAGAAIAHHETKKSYEQQQAYDEAPADDSQEETQAAPPPADPADEIEHLAQLHLSGALTDEEFADAKAKVLGS
jgi:hypothetical protein